MSWGPGTLILNRYRLESLLGRGGMGSVWKAEHIQLKSPVAVKLLDPSIATNEQILSRFLREAQAAASLRSPHVVQIFDYGVEEGTAFIAMEMLHGQSLADRITAVGKLGADDTFRFLQQVLRAIAKAHEAGIVHRDLKPDNIFICQDEPEFAKVLDFGVAKVKSGDLLGSAGSRTQTGMMIGTPYYMSPEQTQAKDIDARADLWGIAVIAFECLTGRRPFLGDSFGELVIGINTKPVPIPSQCGVVPAGFDEWFVKATQRDRDRRFQSAKDMADELARVGGGAGMSLRTPIRSQQTPAIAQVASAQTGAIAPKKDLQLTTGARSVTSQSVGSAAGRSPLVLALFGVGALVVVTAAAFVALGGPRALMQSGASASAAPAVGEPQPVMATVPPPGEPARVALPPSASPSTTAAQALVDDKASKTAPEAEKRSKPDKPSDAPVKRPAAVNREPKPAAPAAPAPPKDWNF